MKTRARRLVVSFVAMLLWGLAPMRAASAPAPADDAATEALAKQLVARFKVNRGICSMPRSGHGKLALAIANQSELLVHALCTDTTGLQAVRTRAADSGMLGRRFLAEAGTPAAIPFADGYVNLLLIADLTDADLATLPAKEITRVLAPQTGTAVCGLAKGFAGQLTQSKLEAWVKTLGIPEARVEQDATGLWATIPKPAQAGSDDWTHRLHGIDNNAVSKDTACAWPVMTQWLGLPLLASQPLIVVAGGRMAAVYPLNWGAEACLVMQDVHNGRLLWSRELPSSAVATRTNAIVLTPSTLYLAEGSDVILYNPATGQETARISCKDLDAQVKWLALDGNTLYAMAGPMEKKAMASQTWKIFSTVPENGGRGSALGAYDLSGGKWRWTQKHPDLKLDEAYVCMGNGRVYYLLHGQHLACVEAATGKPVWTSAPVAEGVAQFKTGDSRGHIGAMLCTDKQVGIIQPGRGAMIISADDGKVLYNPSASALLFKDDLLLAKSGDWRVKTPAVATAIDGKESKALGTPYMGSGCGTFTLSPNLLCGQWGLTHDLKAGKPLAEAKGDRHSPLVHKTPCLAGPFVADGHVIYGAVTCVCGMVVRGTVVQSSAPELPSQADLAAATRLVKAADADRVAALAVSSADWPTFRASNVRSNASGVQMPEKAAIRWTVRPTTVPASAQPAKVTLDANPETIQATAAGDFVFATGQDGAVTAYDLASGAERWRFFTAARLYAPATIWDGRCYLGSGDGRIYCLEATTGRLLWSYRLAPLDRRIMIYGDLVNTWPITGGVLVHEGVAYAIAGINNLDATSVVALDAKTGDVRWRNDASGHIDSYRRAGISGAGFPALAQGRLWLRTASYDLATGKCIAYPDPKNADNYGASNALLNRYTGFFAGKYLVSGGRRYFDITPATEGRLNFDTSFVELSGDNTMAALPVKIWESCRIMPAWDERHLLALPMTSKQARGTHSEDVVCWNVMPAVMEIATRAEQLAALRKKTGHAGLPGLEPDKAKGETFGGAAQAWSREQPHYYGAVLAGNAAVVATGTPGKPAKDAKRNDPLPMTYSVSALNRDTGATLWEVTLPAEPIPDGLSLARDSSVLVRLLDGGVIAVGAAQP